MDFKVSARRHWLRLFVLTAIASSLCACALPANYRKCGLSECPGDAEVSRQVMDALRQHRDLPIGDIYVQTVDHVVYLHGLIDTDRQRYIVIDVARQIHGVLGVVDSLATHGDAY